jgi:hypothetical protein
MPSTPQITAAALPETDMDPGQASKTEELTYQILTVAAILLLLGSLWIL